MALTESAGLLFKIRADGDQAKSELREVEAAIKGTTTTVSGLGSSFSSLAAGAAIAAAGIAAIATAAISAGKALFELASSASEFGSQIFDASQKTGLSAETLSALKIAADQAGSSFEQVTKGIVVFGSEVGKAAQGNEKAIEKMARLKVTSSDLDTALKQVFKTIQEGETDTERLALAADAFGRKIGPDLIPLIKDAGGDLDGLVQKFKELGLTIDDQAAREADEFGDTMDLLGRQVADLGQDIGRLLIPKITELAKELSNLIRDNQDDLQGWADRTSGLFQGVLGYWDDLVAKVKQYGVELEKIKGSDIGGPLAAPLGQRTPIDDALDAVINRGRTRQQNAAPDIVGQSSTFRLPTPEDLEAVAAAKKAAEDRAKEREKAAEREQQAVSKNNRLRIAQERSTFLEVQKEWETAFLAREKTEKEYVDNVIANLKAYVTNVRNLINEGYKQDIVGKTGTEVANLELERVNAIKVAVAEANREKADAIKNIDSLQKKQDADTKKRIDLENRAFEDRIRHAEAVFDAEQRITAEVERRIEYERAAREEEREFFDAQMLGAVNQVITDSLSQEDQPGIFDSFIASWEEFFTRVTGEAPDLASTIEGLAGIAQNAFAGMANAIGSVIEQWVIYGQTGPAVMRRVLAAALASIAAEAAVQAIYAAAWGFIKLAQGDYVAAGNAFVSAALFGAIAVGAALAGRAIAGDSFKKQTASSTGGASGQGSGTQPNVSGQGTQFSGQKDAVINRDINAPGNRGVQVNNTLTVKVEGESFLAKALRFELATNGEIRGMLKEVAQQS